MIQCNQNLVNVFQLFLLMNKHPEILRTEIHQVGSKCHLFDDIKMYTLEKHIFNQSKSEGMT
jgi:hypothetical protein